MLTWLLLSIVAACAAPGSTSSQGAGASSPPSGPPAVLLFAGTGASPNDVTAFERILTQENVSYSRVSSAQLERMSESDLATHRLLLIPGGNFVEMGNGLTPATAARLKTAVGGGLNYLGVCGGAFLAGASPYNGINLTSGVRFPFYGLEDRGVRKAPVAVTTAAGQTIDHYWEDGPQLNGWGEVVARYPDGTPAVVQGHVGDGWVILTGTHPEAPDSWRRGMIFTTPARASNAYAATLIDAALNRKPLPHF